jgi:hypothetical protein
MRSAPIAAAALALAAGCGAVIPPDSTAPLCAADSSDINVLLGSKVPCRLRSGQRVVVAMPHANGSPEALQIVCFRIFRGTVFVHNFGDYDYCALQRQP